jgi:uroporphyrinogen decarboxylase
MTTLYERFLATINHKETHPVPVVGWDNAVPITRMAGVLAKDYYRDAAIKMAVQKRVLDEFSEIRWVPGFHADYGVVVEASAFGCKVEWFTDDSPFAHPIMDSIEQVDRLKVPDPESDGLMPEALAQYRYMWAHLEPRYVEEYGYLDGLGVTLGPLELAAAIRGYENLLMDMHDAPQKLHKLLTITTESALRWLLAQQKINGPLKLLILIDHLPAIVSLRYFEEFAFPYFQCIFAEFPGAVHLYHNEGRSDHYLTRIPDFGAHVFHCGKVDLARAKRTIGDRVCLMGNLDAPGLLLTATPERVRQACLELLRIAAPGGGYLLCTGGAMAPGTPKDNLRAMIQASLDYEAERSPGSRLADGQTPNR